MTILQFQERKTIGIAVEVELMEKIALMGGGSSRHRLHS